MHLQCTGCGVTQTATREWERMRRRIGALVALGLVFHGVWLLSIFDIYFKSPVVHGVAEVASSAPHQQPPRPALARRVVLFVGDGLRADKLFEACATGRAPHLREVAERRGAWGVSHTRVPTESRPCHVAMCAGLYEDVSAVMRGWTDNPVDFDSVFNASRAAWGFGSPDIIPLFSGRAPHMRAACYPSAHEDFGDDGAGAGALDEWVFARVEALFAQAAANASLAAELRTDGAVFFLHLLALDTIGHAAKPHSPRYTAQITAVDKGVARIERLFDEFFGHDGTTAFVFTGDHGMSDRGSHGDGCPENTRTPLLVWGAGIRGPIPGSNSDVTVAESFPTPDAWNLSGIAARHDVNQADLAPLMAALAGVHFPVNSVGVLPVELLSVSNEHRAWLLFQNARQVLAMYQRKHEIRRAAASLYYSEFAPLADSAVAAATAAIQNALAEWRVDDALAQSRALIDTSLQGLAYLQKYDWPLLMSLVVLGYLLWMAVVMAFLAGNNDGIKLSSSSSSDNNKSISIATGAIFAAVAAMLAAFLIAQGLPPMYYLYAALPCLLALCLARSWDGFLLSAKSLRAGLLACCASLSFVLAYYDRRAISIGFIILPVLVPTVAGGLPIASFATLRWTALCVSLAVFPLLPEAMSDNPWLLCIGGLALFVQFHGSGNGFRTALVLLATAIDIAFSLHVIPSSVVHALSWLVLAASLSPWPRTSTPSSAPNKDYERVNRFMLRVAPVFVLLSVSHEPLFLALFCAMLQQWPRLSRNPESLIHVVVYMFLCYASFFSTGNVASLSGFELSSTYRFVTVFSPFLMTALLFAKIFIPFTAVACTFYALRGRSADGFIAAFGLGDVASIAFFFLVRDVGSWLDIGLSISNFAISNLFIVLQLLLLLVAHFVLS